MRMTYTTLILASLMIASPVLARAAYLTSTPGPNVVGQQNPKGPLNRDPSRPDRPDRNTYEVDTTVNSALSSVEAAIKHGREALEAKPSRYEDAEKYYLTAAKLNPKEARAFLGLGTVYAAENRADDAIKAFQKAIELKPKFAEARFNLGMIFVALGETTKALDQYTALETLDKKLATKLKEVIDGKH